MKPKKLTVAELEPKGTFELKTGYGWDKLTIGADGYAYEPDGSCYGHKTADVFTGKNVRNLRQPRRSK
jgi:hypothetical protein